MNPLLPIQEIRRLTAPFQRPQALAWDGSSLWMSSMSTSMLCAMHPTSWEAASPIVAPGVPFGMTSVEGELRVLCGETTEDHRIIRRLVPSTGFDRGFALPCPDDTGSQLAYDGKNIYVSQWYNQCVLRLNAEGEVISSITCPHQICGLVAVGDFLYLMTTDDESTNDYLITRIHLVTQAAEDIARVPFQARALAFDGAHFWTNHREAHETICFALPS